MLLRGCTILWASLLWNARLVFSGLSDEELLDTKLSDHFDVRARPRVGQDIPAKVAASTWLSHIHHFDLNKAELDLTIWLELIWADPRLRWDVQQTENKVRELVLPMDNVWTPDFSINNAVRKITPIFKEEVVVESTGTVAWFQAYRTTIGCVTNKTAEEQTCVLIIGSRRYDVTNVDIFPTSENFTATDDFFSHDWDLLDSSVERSNETRSGMVFPFLEVTMNLLNLADEDTDPTAAPLCMTEKNVKPSSKSSAKSLSIGTIITAYLVKMFIL